MLSPKTIDGRSISSVSDYSGHSDSKSVNRTQKLNHNLNKDSDGSTLDTDENSSSDHSLSSREIVSLSDELEGKIGDILRSESSDSYFFTSTEDRDDPIMRESLSFDIRDDEEEFDFVGTNPCLYNNKSKDSKFPIDILSITKIEPKKKVKAAVIKPRPIKEIRRSASIRSKDYIHVFHGQLHTLEEEPFTEEVDEHATKSGNLDGCIDNNQSWSPPFDENEMIERWNYSLQAMVQRGILTQ